MASTQPSYAPPFEEDGGTPPKRFWFLVAVAAIVGMLAVWVYVLFFYDPGLMIDELADRSFPMAAEEVCAGAKAELDELPHASTEPNAEARADTVEKSNVILSGMIDDLAPLAPTEPPNIRDGVAEWLDDWRTYIADRERYVDNLRSDPEARFLESPKGRSTRGITMAIDSFAEVNRMDSCVTPGDVS